MGPSFELAVIGGGTAALAAVAEALELGVQRIALIEARRYLGGECAQFACVPTHTLMQGAKILKQIRQHAPQYGVQVHAMDVDYAQLRAKVEQVIGEGLDEDYGDRVTTFHESARFLDNHRLQLGQQMISAEKIIIATGAVPHIPAIEGLEEAGYLLFHQATRLEKLPDSLLIIGGGRIGTEFAQIFHWLGCKVTLLEQAERLLPREEPEISGALESFLRQDGIEIVRNARVIKAARKDSRKLIQTEQNQVFEADELLIAAGRYGNTSALNLEAAGVEFDDQHIFTNDEMRTSQPNIWAIGDVVGPYRYTHVADYQAVVAVQNAFKNTGRKADYHAVPWIVYTEPSVAHVGLTEAEALERCLSVVVLKTPATAPTRFRIESATQGFIKVIVDGETDQIVGGHILADQAGEMIHLLALAMANHLPVSQVTQLVYAYPTKSQLVQKVLEQYPREKARMLEAGRQLLQQQQSSSEFLG